MEGWKDLAAGAGGDYRYVYPNHDEHQTRKVADAALIRSSKWLSAEQQGHARQGSTTPSSSSSFVLSSNPRLGLSGCIMDQMTGSPQGWCTTRHQRGPWWGLPLPGLAALLGEYN